MSSYPQPQHNAHHQVSTLKAKLQTSINWLTRSLINKESFAAYLEPVIQLFKPEWRHQKTAAKLISIQHDNNNIYTITLKPAKPWSGFEAGQFVLLSVEINGRMLTRTFSISSAPRDFQNTGLIDITIRAKQDGAVTPWLRQHLKPGNFVYLSDAMGEFCLNSPATKNVFIAAGSGITPIRSMLNQHRDSSWFKDAHLFFYLRKREDIFFIKDLNALQDKGLNLHIMITQETGHFSLAHLDEKLSKQASHTDICTMNYYICGPGDMIESCTSLIRARGVNDANIHFEYFGKAPIKFASNNTDDNEFIQVDYVDSGKQVKFTSGTVKKTLLELAEDEGLQPASGCRMGICHQCICKKKQGRVFNTKTQEYSDSGAEDIQLCLSIPVGNVELEL